MSLWALGLLLSAGASVATAGEPIRFEVLVAKVSPQEGQVDPRGAKLDRAIRDQFRYGQLEVVFERTLRLDIDDVGRVKLPNGRQLMVKPMLLDASGVLVAIDVQGLLQTDLRMKSDHLVVIGAESFEGGKIVISLEPHFASK